MENNSGLAKKIGGVVRITTIEKEGGVVRIMTIREIVHYCMYPQR